MPVTRGCRACLVALAVLPGVYAAAQAHAVTVIRGASVFDSIKGVMLPPTTVVIDGDRVASVGMDSAPPSARIVDAGGKYMIPGLIDAHVHLVHVLDFAHMTGDEVLPLYLASGVTSVRDVGDQIAAEKLVARYAAEHSDFCPRVFLASPLIDRDPPYHRDVGWAVTDPEKVPDFVSDMVAWGVTTLKIYVGTERPVGRRVIEEGRRRGLFVAGHLGRYSAQDAVSDGIDGLEHIWSVFNYIFPSDVPMEERWKVERRASVDVNSPVAKALISDLAAHHVAVDPTIVVFRNQFLLVDQPEILHNADNDRAPARLRSWWEDYRRRRTPPPETLDLRKRELKNYLTLTGSLFRESVPILAGTDSPEPYTPPGGSLHQELQLLVGSGLPPAAALQAATINTARALKAEREIGSIDPGKAADIVILNANPLTDIANTRTIWKVLRAGRLLDPQSLLDKAAKQ